LKDSWISEAEAECGNRVGIFSTRKAPKRVETPLRSERRAYQVDSAKKEIQRGYKALSGSTEQNQLLKPVTQKIGPKLSPFLLSDVVESNSALLDHILQMLLVHRRRYCSVGIPMEVSYQFVG
jgi:hypothetical protein